MSDFSIKKGDRLPVIEATLKDATGTVVSLLSISGVRFIMRLPGAATPKVNAAASVVDAAGGKVRYDWLLIDTDAPGVYEAEWEVTFTGGKIQTFPTPGYNEVEIVGDLDTATALGSFATVADLATMLGRDLNDTEQLQADFLLQAATSAIRTYTGQTISKVIGDVVTLDPAGGVLYLPQIPVQAVSALTVDGVALVPATDVVFYDYGLVYRKSGASWGTTRGSVVVTYTHGYDTVPIDIKLVCLQRAARTLDNPVEARQETIGSYSVTHSVGEGGQAEFTQGEKTILNRYRFPVLG